MRKMFTVMAMVLALALSMAGTAMAASHCESTPQGTANYVNEAPDEAFDVTCDIGIYFDEDGTIDDVEINGTVADAQPVQFGIYIDGADVDVIDSFVTVEDDYPHQFISATYRNGATGYFDNNELVGAHRVGLVLRGAGTDVLVENNTIVGTGSKTSGWAENGIQVDQGAVAAIIDNHIEDHQWGTNDWASTGILLFSDGNTVIDNTVNDNDFGLYVAADNNEVEGNSIEGTWDVLVAGDDNTFVNNQLDGTTDIYIFPGSEDNTFADND